MELVPVSHFRFIHRLPEELDGQNGGDQRARAGDSTQVTAADRGLRLHRFVLRYLWTT